MKKSKASRKAKWESLRFKKNVAHQFTRKALNWNYCSGCGLMDLKNDITRKAMNRSCESMET